MTTYRILSATGRVVMSFDNAFRARSEWERRGRIVPGLRLVEVTVTERDITPKTRRSAA